MAEYIKRSGAMSICQGYSSHCFTTNDANGQDIADRIENDIIKQPTADVVEVVRCRDCKHFFRDSCFNKVWGEGDPVPEVNKNDFCSYGERKEQG